MRHPHFIPSFAHALKRFAVVNVPLLVLLCPAEKYYWNVVVPTTLGSFVRVFCYML